MRTGQVTGEKRRHSVSSVMLYVTCNLVLAWSRTQRSIALSSCESEYLASVGGGAENSFHCCTMGVPGQKTKSSQDSM